MACRQFGFPGDILRSAPLSRERRLVRDALAARTAPLRPVLGSRHDRGPDDQTDQRSEANETRHAYEFMVTSCQLPVVRQWPATRCRLPVAGFQLPVACFQ